MKIYPTAQSYPPNPPSSRLWKDVGFLGCMMSGILLVIVVLKSFSPESGLPKVRKVIMIKQQLEAEVEQLRADNKLLQEELEMMPRDPFWQEKIAREELNMALPEEIIYKFVE